MEKNGVKRKNLLLVSEIDRSILPQFRNQVCLVVIHIAKLKWLQNTIQLNGVSMKV